MNKYKSQGAAISKRSCQLIDKLFDEKIALPQTEYATPQTPLQTRPSSVRGVPQPFAHEIFKRNLISKCRDNWNTPLYRITYFPPWHYTAVGRKTRPAIVVCYQQATEFNGVDVKSPTQTLKTFGSAVWRYRTKFTFKKLFMDAFRPTRHLDGLYVILCRKFPLKHEEHQIKQEFARFLGRITKERGQTTLNTRLDKGKIPANELAKAGLSAPPTFTPQEWTFGYSNRIQAGRVVSKSLPPKE